MDGSTDDGVQNTTIPIREQFRCKRLWFYYHDIRAFTTSWIPLPLFLAYRIALTIYVFIWLVLHIVERTYGPRWLIYISNLSYAMLFISSGLAALLCLVYTVFYYTDRSKLQKYFPRQHVTTRIYDQDNIPWFVKIVWALYIISKCIATLIFLGYWILIYNPCSDQSTSQPQQNNSTSEQELSTNCSTIDVHTIQIHGVNLVAVVLDMFLSRIPYQLFHMFYPMLFTLVYIFFTVIYWAAGGTDPYDQPYIYSVLDYNSSIAFLYGFLLIPAPILSYILIFLLAWLRDVLYSRFQFCFRDVRVHPLQEHVTEKDTVRSNEETQLDTTTV